MLLNSKASVHCGLATLVLALAACGGGGGGGSEASSTPAGTSNGTGTAGGGNGSGNSSGGGSGSNANALALPPLTDTGITSEQCFKAGSNQLVSCSSAEALALSTTQDGMLNRRAMQFSTLGSYPLSSCVQDQQTGLLWEGKEASGRRAGNNLYTHYTSTTLEQKPGTDVPPTASEVDAPSNAKGYIDYVNSLALCGYNDWRLPTLPEMLSLPDYSLVTTMLASDEAFSKTWFVNTNLAVDASAAGLYWTASPNVMADDEAWALYTTFGTSYFPKNRNQTLRVRLVRGGKTTTEVRYSYTSVPYSDPAYGDDLANNVVVDHHTGLQWRRCSEGQRWDGSTCTGTLKRLNHEAALKHAQALAGWRLPDVKELQSLVDRNLNPSYDATAFPGVPGAEKKYYWSSTPVVVAPEYQNSPYNRMGAWAVNFDSAYIEYSGPAAPRDTEARVRLVRIAP